MHADLSKFNSMELIEALQKVNKSIEECCAEGQYSTQTIETDTKMNKLLTKENDVNVIREELTNLIQQQLDIDCGEQVKCTSGEPEILVQIEKNKEDLAKAKIKVGEQDEQQIGGDEI